MFNRRRNRFGSQDYEALSDHIKQQPHMTGELREPQSISQLEYSINSESRHLEGKIDELSLELGICLMHFKDLLIRSETQDAGLAEASRQLAQERFNHARQILDMLGKLPKSLE